MKEFVKGCVELGLRVNAGKSKILWIKNGRGGEGKGNRWSGELQIKVRKEILEWFNSFKFLGVNFLRGEGSVDDEVGHRIREGKKVLGGLRDIWNRGRLSRGVKLKMFEGCCVSVVMYGIEKFGA